MNVTALGRQKSDFSTPRLFFEEKLPKVVFSADWFFSRRNPETYRETSRLSAGSAFGRQKSDVSTTHNSSR